MTEPTFRVLGLAGDPGGAEAIAPVISALQAMPQYEVVLNSYRHATAVFERHHLQPNPLPEDYTQADFCRQLADQKVQFVLAATSVNGVDLEQQLLAACNVCQVPSLSIVDSWFNYTQRYEDRVSGERHAPSLYAVPDADAKQGMIAEGFPAEKIIATGQPAFDRLSTYDQATVADLRESIRGELGASDKDTVITFASQPLISLHGGEKECLAKLGYTEHSVFELISDAVDRLRSAEREKRVFLILQPHPRESHEDWRRCLAGRDMLIEPTQHRTLEVGLASDLVMSMTSVLLHEARLLGLPVLGVAPGSGTRLPGVPYASSHETSDGIALAERIGAELGAMNERQPAPLNATERVLSAFTKLPSATLLGCER